MLKTPANASTPKEMKITQELAALGFKVDATKTQGNKTTLIISRKESTDGKH